GARAGLQVGDVILSVGGEPQRRPYDLIRVVGRAPSGRKLPLAVLRDGKPLALEVAPEGAATPWPDPGAFADWLERGLEMGSEELLEQLRRLEDRLDQLEKEIERGRRPGDGGADAERT
ncbi:MAG: PDZ domain-containing protein, partial [Myxococcales bacterium]|nr:PDZ domain-containing protein [Myxococcales bacterium]